MERLSLSWYIGSMKRPKYKTHRQVIEDYYNPLLLIAGVILSIAYWEQARPFIVLLGMSVASPFVVYFCLTAWQRVKDRRQGKA